MDHSSYQGNGGGDGGGNPPTNNSSGGSGSAAAKGDGCNDRMENLMATAIPRKPLPSSSSAPTDSSDGFTIPRKSTTEMTIPRKPAADPMTASIPRKAPPPAVDGFSIPRKDNNNNKSGSDPFVIPRKRPSTSSSDGGSLLQRKASAGSTGFSSKQVDLDRPIPRRPSVNNHDQTHRRPSQEPIPRRPSSYHDHNESSVPRKHSSSHESHREGNGLVSIKSEHPFTLRIKTKRVPLDQGMPRQRVEEGMPQQQPMDLEEGEEEEYDMSRHRALRTPKRQRPSYEELPETDSDDLVDSDEDDVTYGSRPKKLRKSSKSRNGPEVTNSLTAVGVPVEATTAGSATHGDASRLVPAAGAAAAVVPPGYVIGPDGVPVIDSPPPGALHSLWYSRECFLHLFVMEKVVGWKKRPVTTLEWGDPNALKFLDPVEAAALQQKTLTNENFWDDPRKRMDVSRINLTQCPVVMAIAAAREKAKAERENREPNFTLKAPTADQLEEVLLVKWRGRSHMHCSWERPSDIQKLDPSNNTARHKIRRYYQTQELTLGLNWKKQLEEERATAAAIHSHGEAAHADNSVEQAEETDEFFPPQCLEVERILACDESEMDMTVLAKQRALNMRAEQESLRLREQQEAQQVDEGPIKPKPSPYLLDELVDINNADDPWDPEDNVRYVVKWKGLPFSDLTWEYWRDIKRDAVDEAENFWHRQKPPSPEEVKQIVSQPHPHIKDFRKMQESRSYGDSAIPRPVADLGDGKVQQDEDDADDEKGFKLRGYQLEGVQWLMFNYWNKRSCILADEMGLGKTIQSMCFLQELQLNPNVNVRGPFLIVAPLSLVGQWQSEAKSWAPDLNVLLYHGSADAREFLVNQEFYYTDQFVPKATAMKLKKQHITKFHILITTYEVVLKDIAVLSKIRWKTLIVDEAHRLKNPNSRLFAELATVPRDFCVLLTGTPLANATEELWALLHFDDPSAFADKDEFLEKFGQLTDATQVEELHNVLKPYLLRRVKEDVEKSLPPKEETILEVSLTPIQKKYYKAIYERNTAFLFKGAKPSNAPSLMNVMMELRKCCNHPYLVKGAEDRILADASANWNRKDEEGNDMPVDYVKLFGEQLVKSSGKMVLIEKLLLKLFTAGHKVLIFSQMVRVLDLLEELLKIKRYRYERLDGSTSSSSRAAAVDRFNKKSLQRFVMLLSTRAGGLGLNLTAADIVIIFDSDWNPQNDLQAMARAHRIGQTRKVSIYRLLTAKTYEMHMFHSASMKLGLERAVLSQQRDQGDETDENQKKPSDKAAHAKEIDELLKKGAYDVFRDDDDKEAEKFMETDIDQLLERSSKKVTYGGQATNNLGGGLGSFSKASFVADTGDGEKDVDLDDPDFWQKAVGLDAPVETPEEVAQMLDDGVKRSRKQVQQFNPYAEFEEKEQRKQDIINMKIQAEKEEKERIRLEKKKAKRKKEQEKEKLKLKKRKEEETKSQSSDKPSVASVEEVDEPKKVPKEVFKPKKPKKNDRKRVLRRAENEDPVIERLKQGWEVPQRNRATAAALRFGFGRFTKIRHESSLTSLPLQDMEVFIRSYIYQLSLQIAVTFLAKIKSNSSSDGKDLQSLVREWLGPRSSAEVDWICSSIHSVMELHFEVESRRRFLRMPRILADPAFVTELREGAAFRALRRVGILARLNRVVEDAMDSVLSILGHEELAKRGCATNDLSTLDADLRARHVSAEEMSLATGYHLRKAIGLRAPAVWWDRHCDVGLMIGTFIHGLGNYEAMRNDEELPFANNIKVYADSDQACCFAVAAFYSAASAARKVFDDALEAAKTKAAIEVQAAVAAAAAAASEREKDALALRQGGAAADAVLSTQPDTIIPMESKILEGRKGDDSHFVTITRLQKSMTDAIRKTTDRFALSLPVSADLPLKSGGAKQTDVKVVHGGVVADVHDLSMPDSRVLNRRLLELVNEVEASLDNVDGRRQEQTSSVWQKSSEVSVNQEIRSLALSSIISSHEELENILSEYEGVGLNGTQCGANHRSLDDGSDFSIGPASSDLAYVAYGTDAPRYLRAIGVPMNLTRFAVCALVYAESSTLEQLLSNEQACSYGHNEKDGSTMTQGEKNGATKANDLKDKTMKVKDEEDGTVKAEGQSNNTTKVDSEKDEAMQLEGGEGGTGKTEGQSNNTCKVDSEKGKAMEVEGQEDGTVMTEGKIGNTTKAYNEKDEAMKLEGQKDGAVKAEGKSNNTTATDAEKDEAEGKSDNAITAEGKENETVKLEDEKDATSKAEGEKKEAMEVEGEKGGTAKADDKKDSLIRTKDDKERTTTPRDKNEASDAGKTVSKPPMDRLDLIPLEFRGNVKLRAAICSTILLYGFPTASMSEAAVDTSLWTMLREKSDNLDSSSGAPDILFNMDSFVSCAKRLARDIDFPDPKSICAYVEKLLLPHCVRLCVMGNGPTTRNARGSKGEFDTAFGICKYPEPSKNVQSPLPDPCLPIAEHSIEAVAHACAILRRVRLLRTAAFVASGGVSTEELSNAACSSFLCKNLDGLPLWWCPWIHDLALLVTAATKGLFGSVVCRSGEGASSLGVFSHGSIVKAMHSTFVADDSVLPKSIVNQSAPDDVSDWIELNAKDFPTANVVERRLAFLCSQATATLSGEVRYDNLPMFDHGGWPRA